MEEQQTPWKKICQMLVVQAQQIDKLEPIITLLHEMFLAFLERHALPEIAGRLEQSIKGLTESELKTCVLAVYMELRADLQRDLNFFLSKISALVQDWQQPSATGPAGGAVYRQPIAPIAANAGVVTGEPASCRQ